VENLRIACRACNLLAARRAFGDAVMDRYARRKARLRGSAADPAPMTSDLPAPPPRQHAFTLATLQRNSSGSRTSSS
jgi:hypothetical protein